MSEFARVPASSSFPISKRVGSLIGVTVDRFFGGMTGILTENARLRSEDAGIFFAVNPTSNPLKVWFPRVDLPQSGT